MDIKPGETISELRLPDEWVTLLTNNPESGMGFQLVTVDFEDGNQAEGVIVLGSMWMLLPESWHSKKIVGISV